MHSAGETGGGWTGSVLAELKGWVSAGEEGMREGGRECFMKLGTPRSQAERVARVLLRSALILHPCLEGLSPQVADEETMLREWGSDLPKVTRG